MVSTYPETQESVFQSSWESLQMKKQVTAPPRSNQRDNHPFYNLCYLRKLEQPRLDRMSYGDALHYF